MHHLHSPFILDFTFNQGSKGVLWLLMWSFRTRGKCSERFNSTAALALYLSTSTRWRINGISLVLSFLKILTPTATIILQNSLTSVFSNTSSLMGSKPNSCSCKNSPSFPANMTSHSITTSTTPLDCF